MMMKGMPKKVRTDAIPPKVQSPEKTCCNSKVESENLQDSNTDTVDEASNNFLSSQEKKLRNVKSVDDVEFLYVYLRDRWSVVKEKLGGKHTEEELFQICKEKWFKKNFDPLAYPLATPDRLEKPRYVYTLEECKEVERSPEPYVTVLKNIMGKWGLNNKLFEIDFIQKTYGEYITDIRVQTPLVQGFNVRSSKYLQEIDEMLVKDYVDYQKTHKQMYLLDKNTMDEKIRFAVNLDIGNFPEQLFELYSKVPHSIYCNRDEDLQGYLRKHIPGMSVPQIYLKVAGCWTGGHQENLSLRAVNVNHGPGEVEWYCMEADEAYRFNELIMKEKGLNLLKLEGLWYIPLEEVLKRGFKVSKFVQETGDVVVLAPGTLHWVRSYSHTVNSAWNIGEYSYLSFSQLFKRYEFNCLYGFRVSFLLIVRTSFQ